MAHHNTPIMASGDINPCRFVTLSGSFKVAESNAGEVTFGISQEGAREAPLPNGSTLAAKAGEPVDVHEDGEHCLLQLGSGGATYGNFLKPDADGKGIVASADKDFFGAQALETGLENQKILVKVVRGYLAA